RRELTRPAPGATRAGLLPANRPAPTEVYTLSLHDALPIYLDQNRSVVRYNDFAREIVALFKYRGRERLARPLGRMMAEEACKMRSEEHTSELQSRENLVCRLLLEKKNTKRTKQRRDDPWGQ